MVIWITVENFFILTWRKNLKKNYYFSHSLLIFFNSFSDKNHFLNHLMKTILLNLTSYDDNKYVESHFPFQQGNFVYFTMKEKNSLCDKKLVNQFAICDCIMCTIGNWWIVWVFGSLHFEIVFWTEFLYLNTGWSVNNKWGADVHTMVVRIEAIGISTTSSPRSEGIWYYFEILLII